MTPKNGGLLVSRANIALRGGRVEEGVTFLQKALTINPLNGRALRTMGAVTEQFGDIEEAERYYSAALASDPNDAYALLFRSKTYMTRQRFDDARKDATALVAIPAGAINRQGYLDETGDRRDFHIIALKTRAQIYRAIGRLDLAERDLTERSATGDRSNRSPHGANFSLKVRDATATR